MKKIDIDFTRVITHLFQKRCKLYYEIYKCHFTVPIDTPRSALLGIKQVKDLFDYGFDYDLIYRINVEINEYGKFYLRDPFIVVLNDLKDRIKDDCNNVITIHESVPSLLCAYYIFDIGWDFWVIDEIIRFTGIHKFKK